MAHKKEYIGIYNDIHKCLESEETPIYCSIIKPEKGDAACLMRGNLVTIVTSEAQFGKKSKDTVEQKYICLKKPAMELQTDGSKSDSYSNSEN
jgi:hypothetical protein